jgi:hypothetical protein
MRKNKENFHRAIQYSLSILKKPFDGQVRETLAAFLRWLDIFLKWYWRVSKVIWKKSAENFTFPMFSL